MAREIWKENNPPGDCCGDPCGDAGCRIYVPCCIQYWEWQGEFINTSNEDPSNTVISQWKIKNNCNQMTSVDYSNHQQFSGLAGKEQHSFRARFDDFFGVSDEMTVHDHFFCSCNTDDENFEVTIRVCNVGTPGFDGAEQITIQQNDLFFNCGEQSHTLGTIAHFPLKRISASGDWTNTGGDNWQITLAPGTESSEIKFVYGPADYSDCTFECVDEGGDAIEIASVPIDCHKKVQCIGPDLEPPQSPFTERSCDDATCPDCDCSDGAGLCTCGCGVGPGFPFIFQHYKGPYKRPIPSGNLTNSEFDCCFAANVEVSLGYSFRKPRAGDPDSAPHIVELLTAASAGGITVYYAEIWGKTDIEGVISSAFIPVSVTASGTTCSNHHVEVEYSGDNLKLSVGTASNNVDAPPGWIGRYTPDAAYYGMEPGHAITATPPRQVTPVTIYV